MTNAAHLLIDNLHAQSLRVARACARAGRNPSDVRLVAVSKNHPVEAISSLLGHGHLAFGESYVQEWRTKADQLSPQVDWHFIGHLQSNKASAVAGSVSLIHSVDRPSLVRALAGTKQDVLIQVNISGETSKYGCRPEETAALIEKSIGAGGLRVRGLMTMAPWDEDPEASRPCFRALRTLRDELSTHFSARFDGWTTTFGELSMGMSHDLETAVEEGATLVRVGTAIFGERE
jgi:hypothetical protein